MKYYNQVSPCTVVNLSQSEDTLKGKCRPYFVLDYEVPTNLYRSTETPTSKYKTKVLKIHIKQLHAYKI